MLFEQQNLTLTRYNVVATNPSKYALIKIKNSLKKLLNWLLITTLSSLISEFDDSIV